MAPMYLSYGIEFLLVLQDVRESMSDLSIRLVSTFTDLAFFAIPAVIVMVLIWKGRMDVCAKLLIAYALAHTIYILVNLTLEIPRPWIVDPRILPAKLSYGYSFPSGHVLLSTAFFGMLSLICRKRWLVAVSVLLVAFVAFARMLLGAHTPADVIGGFAVGMASVAIAEYGTRRYDGDLKRFGAVGAAVSVAGMAFFIANYLTKDGAISVGNLGYVINMTLFTAAPLAAYALSDRFGWSFELPNAACIAAGVLAYLLASYYNRLLGIPDDMLCYIIRSIAEVLVVAYPVILNRVMESAAPERWPPEGFHSASPVEPSRATIYIRYGDGESAEL